ncbi:hypothetical protein CSA56_10555 [candidate division KSB3 bacterium]|uniref:Uncharacterized protein n=1 Tax=candidate division KSB3 bacterium TaxID=2044937 RepID=A0A2G6KDM6_9BACT|nr:MAG: hypothetical protein CSA56_10555 [candidate division KSB3 bacterium]
MLAHRRTKAWSDKLLLASPEKFIPDMYPNHPFHRAIDLEDVIIVMNEDAFKGDFRDELNRWAKKQAHLTRNSFSKDSCCRLRIV